MRACTAASAPRLPGWTSRVAGEEALPLLGDYSLARPAVRYRSTPNAYVWENLFVTPVRPSARRESRTPKGLSS